MFKSDYRLSQIAAIIESVDDRCMAADGPVSRTANEMTDTEWETIYRLATGRKLTQKQKTIIAQHLIAEERCAKLERELEEAKTEQNAWYKIFGTQQLTHAIAERDQLRAEWGGDDSLWNRIADLKGKLRKVQFLNYQLRAVREELRAALGFYAEEENYDEDSGAPGKGVGMNWHEGSTEPEYWDWIPDLGRIARQAVNLINSRARKGEGDGKH